MTFEERIDRLTEQKARSEKDGQHMRILAGIAEATLDSIKRMEAIVSA
jgi:hypothetical protein